MAVVDNYTALLSGSNWNASLVGRPAFVTYSFDTSARAYLAAFGYSQAARDSFQPFSAADQAMARNALGQWAAGTGLYFIEAPAGQGDISFSRYDFSLIPDAAGFAGFGYYGGVGIGGGTAWKSDIGGDVLIDSASTNSVYLMLHEIGHALGFKHPFEDNPTLSPTYDDHSWTVMSYTGSSPNMLGPFDVQAAQYVYGATDGAHLAAWGWDGSTLTQIDGDEGDSLIGTSVNDLIRGFGGGDTAAGFEGNDWLDGGEGLDWLYGGAGGDSVFGGGGADMVYGEAGDDVVAGDAGDDQVYGGAGNDIVTGDAGNDTLHGGDGNDVLSELWFPLDLGNDIIWAGNGIDIIYAGAGNDSVDGGGGADGANNYANLGDGADSYQGSSGTDVVEGGAGNDSIEGRVGDDSLWADAGNDTVWGGAGIDTIVGGPGDDFLYGEADNDLLVGQDGLDFLAGGLGVDVLYGGAADDTLNGGAGVDALYGGAGGDRFQVGGTDYGIDYIWDFSVNLDRVAVWSGAAIASQFTSSGNYYINFTNGSQAVLVGVTAVGALDIELSAFIA